LRLLRERWPELLIVLLGLAIRMALSATYDVRWSYDFEDHLHSIGWFATRGWSWMPLDWARTAYHPPLYYAFAAFLTGHGVGIQGLGMVSVVAGCLRFALLFFGLELLLPDRRAARLGALALAAVLPASVQLDGMVTNEGLSCLFSTVALAILIPLFGARGRARYYWAAALGLTLGLALLVKVSALVILAAAGVAAGLEALREKEGGPRARLRRLAPFALGLAVLGATSGWYFVHNQRAYGKAVISGFDGADAYRAAPYEGIPYLRKRPLSFFVGWTPAIFGWPYAPVGIKPSAQFWTPLVASTFVDYYNFAYAPYPDPAGPHELGNFRPLRHDVRAVSRFSMIGGTLIALATLAAFFPVLAGVWRRREYGRLAFLLAPLFAIAGQLHFSVKYPIDSEGMIKGTYVQFAAAPLYVLFGLAVAWLWSRRPFGRALAVAQLAAVAAVAYYTIYCRLI
jgi:hypothetical protein